MENRLANMLTKQYMKKMPHDWSYTITRRYKNADMNTLNKHVSDKTCFREKYLSACFNAYPAKNCSALESTMEWGKYLAPNVLRNMASAMEKYTMSKLAQMILRAIRSNGARGFLPFKSSPLKWSMLLIDRIAISLRYEAYDNCLLRTIQNVKLNSRQRCASCAERDS